MGSQLAATDPTWDVTNFGGFGSLWFPHVYMPNQNPYDLSGANAFGRWDYGPWFWPVFNNLTDGPVPCTSAAFPGATLTCPGTPNPSGTPEGFMDTPVVNGTAYPRLAVDPAAYRFHILTAGNDRTLNLQLYVAEPLSISIANGGAGYSAPTVVIGDAGGTGTGATASATVSTGSVELVTLMTGGTGYTTPTVSFSGGGSGTVAVATVDPATGAIATIQITNAGGGYTSAPTVTISDPSAGASGATALATITPAGTITAVTVTNAGSNYTAPTVTISDSTGTGALAVAAANSEVKMIAAIPPTTMPRCGTMTAMGEGGLATATLDAAGNPINNTGLPAGCWPSYVGAGNPTWPTDGRDGGVPDPTTAGPPIVQIGSEGGLLPSPAVIPSTPTGFDYNRRSITVLNVLNHGLYLGPAERADVVIDFSAFAGKTLILYNDAPAPVPAADPRSDYYTNNPDQSATGGTPTTMAGYGPNTRTIMQIQVKPSGAGNATRFNILALQNALPNIFAATQDTVIVPQTAYPLANGAGPANYARISDNFMSFFSGGPIGGLSLTSAGGAGYVAPPTVTIAPPPSPCPLGLTCVQATARANLAPTSVGGIVLTSGGSYNSVPTVTIINGSGTGATAAATLATRSVASITITNNGKGYTTAPAVAIAPPSTPLGTTATATATVNKGNIASITITNPGSGYTAAPAVTFTGGGGSGAAGTAVLTPAAVASVAVVNPGAGYTTTPTVTFSGGGSTGGAAATAMLTPTVIASLTLTNAGSGYTSAPSVTISAPTAPGTFVSPVAIATPPTIPLLPKTIQELFTTDFGRMNATLGVEVPFTTATVQTTIPYGYVDPPTEIFKDGETQL